MRQQESKDFGNGRYVRNILEQAKMNQATILEYDLEDIITEEITTIKAVDIVIRKRKSKKSENWLCLLDNKWYIKNCIIKIY